MIQKKLMLLGGIRYLLPAIEAAHRHGCHVITVDYLPDNIAHKYSDEYHNVSTTDLDGVLSLAQELKIDGIVAYASDGVKVGERVTDSPTLVFEVDGNEIAVGGLLMTVTSQYTGGPTTGSKVIVALPGLTAVTFPFLSTVATLSRLDSQVIFGAP